MKYIGQLVAYAAFFVLLGALSVRPRLRLMAEDEAIVSLSFSHAAKRVGECRQLSQEELMALPPNMRKPEDCPRERHPLRIILLMDDQTLYQAKLPPTGLWVDGKATAYQRIRVLAGAHDFTMRMNDSGTSGWFDFEDSSSINLLPGQNLVVYFDADGQQFRFHQVSR
jgi:hypothetical protein